MMLTRQFCLNTPEHPMTNTDHTPFQHDNDQKEVQAAQKARAQEVDGVNETNGAHSVANPAPSAQSAHTPNTREQAAHPLPIADTDGNSTTGQDSVEQDDEDIGGDQDRAPEPKVVPVIDKHNAEGRQIEDENGEKADAVATEVSSGNSRSETDQYL